MQVLLKKYGKMMTARKMGTCRYLNIENLSVFNEK